MGGVGERGSGGKLWVGGGWWVGFMGGCVNRRRPIIRFIHFVGCMGPFTASELATARGPKLAAVFSSL